MNRHIIFIVSKLRTIYSFKIYRLRSDFEEVQRKEESRNEGVLKVTTIMIRTVFLEIKKNIPFDAHNSIVVLQEMHGVNMGHHHREKCGAIAIMETISKNMHKLLMKHIISKNLPFSLIVDGSTDSSDVHFMSIFFQILEDNVPVIVFYKLVELSVDVSARGIHKSIVNAFESEELDFLNYFKRNIVGFASDGEPVMAGRTNGLVALVRKDAKNFIFASHCMAHKLELVIKYALLKHEYFKTFESNINELFQFYNLNAPKRKAHLRETAKKNNWQFYELNSVYHTRWISSELQSIKNLQKMWRVLATDLTEIGKGVNTFERETKRMAINLEAKIKSKYFIVILNFINDILYHLSFW